VHHPEVVAGWKCSGDLSSAHLQHVDMLNFEVTACRCTPTSMPPFTGDDNAR